MQKKIISFIVWTTFLSQQVFAQACLDVKCCCADGQQNTILQSHQHGRDKNSIQVNKLKWDGPGPRRFEDPKVGATDENSIMTAQADSSETPHCHQQNVTNVTPTPASKEAMISHQDVANQSEHSDHGVKNVPRRIFSAPLTPSDDFEQTTILLESVGEKFSFVSPDTDETIQISVLAKRSNDNECACEKMNAAGIYSCTCGKKTLSTPSPIQLFQALTWEKIDQLAFVIFPLKSIYLSVPNKSPDTPPPRHFAITHI